MDEKQRVILSYRNVTAAAREYIASAIVDADILVKFAFCVEYKRRTFVRQKFVLDWLHARLSSVGDER